MRFKRILICIPESYDKYLKELVRQGRYRSKNEAIRKAILSLISNEVFCMRKLKRRMLLG